MGSARRRGKSHYLALFAAIWIYLWLLESTWMDYELLDGSEIKAARVGFQLELIAMKSALTEHQNPECQDPERTPR